MVINIPEIAMNHKDICPGDLICIQCGRRGCSGCIYNNETNRDHANKSDYGKCVVCVGTWKEHNISLYPVPAMEWDR